MKTILIIIFISLLAGNNYAQELSRTVVSSAGNSNETLSFTLGELAIETKISGSFIMTQGFQQPEAEGVASSVEDLSVNVSFELYPNPAREMVFLKVASNEDVSLFASITDLQGKVLLKSDKISPAVNELTEFDISRLEAGYYIMILHDREGNSYKNLRFLKIRD